MLNNSKLVHKVNSINVVVGVVVSNAVNNGFEPQSTQITINVCWFCAKQATLSSKSKDLYTEDDPDISKPQNG